VIYVQNAMAPTSGGTPFPLALLFITAGPANAQTGTIAVGPTAKRVARGAAVDVPFTVSLTCEEGFDVGLVEVTVLQAHGQGLVTGLGQETFTCDGTTQTVTVRAATGTARFHGGSALVTAALLQCQDVDGTLLCEYVGIDTSEQIRIRAN
jgi:hypothetical protein